MTDPWADGLAVIRAAVAVAVTYSADDLGELERNFPRVEEPADEFQGFAGKARRVSFEIPKADLSRKPRKGDLIVETEAADRWRVNDVANRGDIGAWIVIVEDAGPEA